MPSAEDGNKILEFKDFEKALRVPFAIYLDFESSLAAVPDEEQLMSAQKSKREGVIPNTERLQLHRTNSYCAVVLGPNDEKLAELFYRGPSARKAIG